MAEYTVQALTKLEGIEAAKEKLSAADRKSLESRFGEFQGVLADKINELEIALVETYSDADRFGNYQIFCLNEVTDEKIKKLAQIPSALNFLSRPSRLDWSVHPFHSQPKVAFAKHMVSERRVEKIETIGAESRTVYQVEPQDVLFYAEAEIVRTNKGKALLIVKLPWYRRKLSQIYPFKDEVAYIVTWISEKAGIELSPFEIKKFFEDFKSHSYFDKAEFRVSGLPSESGVVPVDMRVANLQSGLTNAYANLDVVLESTLKTDQMKFFAEFVQASDLKNKEQVIELGIQFFSKFSFSSEEFFEVLHQTFEYGLGTITYSKDKSILRYKLDYSEDMSGLIRASRLGWDIFEKIFGEITKFIDQ